MLNYENCALLPIIFCVIIKCDKVKLFPQSAANSCSIDNSYGFRPGRSTHQAISQATKYIKEGYEWVVDIDLEKFFDKINHDRLMQRLSKGIGDKRLLRLINAFLKTGIMEGGLKEALCHHYYPILC